MIKKLLTIFLLVIAIRTDAQTQNATFDKSLADSLGSDDYGMKMYVFVILRTGTNKTKDSTIRDSLFRGHMKNIGRLAEMGKLVVAGPFEKNPQNYRGLFILNVQTIDEARVLLETDPAIKAKIFDTDLFQWYGSAALPLYKKYHDRVKKMNF